MDFDRAFQTTKLVYKGKTLAEWFANFCANPPQGDFFKVLTTFVVQNFMSRRKGGVPVGQLDKFILKGNPKINFVQHVAWYLWRILKKRGLKEADEQMVEWESESTFYLIRELDEAFRKAQKN